MKSKQEYKRVFGVLVSLDLLKHGLSLLQ